MDQPESREEFLARIKRSRNIFKFCLVGDGGTGKTTFARFLSSGEMSVCENPIKRTPYMDFASADLGVGKVQLIDLAGQRVKDAHPLDHIPHTALRGADVIVFFFSLDNFESFLSVKAWYDEIRTLFTEWDAQMPTCYLVGNKSDLDRKVEALNGIDMVERFVEFKEYYETSLLSGENLEKLVNALENDMRKRE
ncbi:MAG: hypothetical protein ACFFD9_09610 [Candidatus Thorarchaeota archaeon]